MDNKLWAYNELLAFVLIHASHADLEFSEKEKNIIQNEVGSEIFQKMNDIYDQGSDYQNLEKILKHKERYFSTPQKKEAFLNKLKEQFHADGDFSRLEKIMLKFLEMMMSF